MMGKIRVHELAKELGLENKEVIQRLQQAGISVKTHSSSVQEDEARAVFAVKAAAPQKPAMKRPGMVIVRKRDKQIEGRDKAVEEATKEAHGYVEPIATGAEDAGPNAQASQAASEAAAASLSDELAGAEQHTAEVGAPTEAEPTEAAADQGAAVTAQEGGETPAVGKEQVAAETGASEESAEAAPAPAGKPPEGERTTGAQVVRMIDREKLLERVPQRRLGSEQPSGPKFGQVTELRVVQDPFGRGREMIAVGKDKKGGKAGAKAPRKTRAPSKREMMEMRERSMHPARLRKKKGIKRVGRKTEVTQPKASKRVIKMKEAITIADLAQAMGVKAMELLRHLSSMDQEMALTQFDAVDFDTAQLLANEFEYTVESIAFKEEDVLGPVEAEETDENLESRPPVVTVMGHVDHGKTSLLDAIRKTRVAAREAGGITQHIGAYQVELPKKGVITFLDTPGHAAFTAMRARGAQATDIVILVVAADDGVMPQTEEAIKHAQAAGVPIIVAVNKIDKPDANVDRVTQELTKFNLVPESWGGDTLFVQTSAIKGTGIPELLESVLLQSEVMELKANPKRAATGVVVEASLDKGRGPVATLLVQQGTLERGQFIVVGHHQGKVRAMTDDTGKQVKKAGPSTPVEVIGLSSVPDAGDQLYVVDSEKQAREVVEHRVAQKKDQEAESRGTMSLDELMAKMKGDEAAELRVVLKGDVQGSVEAVRDTIVKLSTEDVRVNVIYAGVGAISESDIMLATASQGLVLGFNVRPDSKGRAIAEREKVEIRTYNIIYEMVDDIKKAMEGLLEPDQTETVVGRADVREVFRIAKIGTIAGCRVVDGKALRTAKVRLLRDSVQIYDGRLASLKRFKDDVREVEAGSECGIGIEGFNDIKQGDIIEFYQIEEVARALDSGPRKRRGNEEGGGMQAHP